MTRLRVSAVAAVAAVAVKHGLFSDPWQPHRIIFDVSVMTTPDQADAHERQQHERRTETQQNLQQQMSGAIAKSDDVVPGRDLDLLHQCVLRFRHFGRHAIDDNRPAMGSTVREAPTDSPPSADNDRRVMHPVQQVVSLLGDPGASLPVGHRPFGHSKAQTQNFYKHFRCLILNLAEAEL